MHFPGCTVVVAQLDVVKKLKRVLCSSPDDVILKWQNKISADSVKRVWHQIFDFRLTPEYSIGAISHFLQKFTEIFANQFLSLVSPTLAITCSLASTTLAKNLLLVIYPCHVFFVIDCYIITGNKFNASDNNTGEQLSPLTTTLVINYCPWKWHMWTSCFGCVCTRLFMMVQIKLSTAISDFCVPRYHQYGYTVSSFGGLMGL